MLKLSFYALRGYAHTRTESWNIEINRAISELTAYEQAIEFHKEERVTLLTSHQNQQPHQKESPQLVVKVEPSDVNMSMLTMVRNGAEPGISGAQQHNTSIHPPTNTNSILGRPGLLNHSSTNISNLSQPGLSTQTSAITFQKLDVKSNTGPVYYTHLTLPTILLV